MNDLTQHSVLISREVLEEEFGLSKCSVVNSLVTHHQ